MLCVFHDPATWTDDSPVYKTTAFVPFRLIDNPFYGEDKRRSLMTQSKVIQQQLLYGCWCNAAGLYFDFMRPDDVVPYASIGDSWWWQHFIAIDYGYGNSAASAGMYAINPNGVVFKTRERIERKMSALRFALGICKSGFKPVDYPKQAEQDAWLKKLKARDPEPPRISFCVMDSAMNQHRGTGRSVYEVMAEVFGKYGIGSIEAAHDPQGNAQVLKGFFQKHQNCFVISDKKLIAETSHKPEPHVNQLNRCFLMYRKYKTRFCLRVICRRYTRVRASFRSPSNSATASGYVVLDSENTQPVQLDAMGRRRKNIASSEYGGRGAGATGPNICYLI